MGGMWGVEVVLSVWGTDTPVVTGLSVVPMGLADSVSSASPLVGMC